MSLQEKANELVDAYKVILMNEDTDCGEEILCTVIAKQCALIAVDEILNEYWLHDTKRRDWWQEVKHELKKL